MGFDYSVVAFQPGIYGQISMDMQFQWLNRSYMNDQATIKNTADGGTNGTLDGQRVRIDGEIGLEFLVKFLFVSFNKVLFSYSFNIADYTFSSWDSIQSSWEANQKANQQAIEELLSNGSLSVNSVGGAYDEGSAINDPFSYGNS